MTHPARPLASVLAGILLSALLSAPTASHADDTVSFFRAIRQDNTSAMLGLLLRGVSPNLVDEKGISGLHLALAEESTGVARILIDAPGLQPDSRNAVDESPLMMACLKGYTDLALRLIQRGAAVHKTGWTPLHYAASGGHTDTIALLLRHGAPLDARAPNGATPLMMAAAYGSAAAVKQLIEAGADIHLRNQHGLSALDFARNAERPDAISLLTQAERLMPARPAAAAAPIATQTTPVPAPPPAMRQHPRTRGHW